MLAGECKVDVPEVFISHVPVWRGGGGPPGWCTSVGDRSGACVSVRCAVIHGGDTAAAGAHRVTHSCMQSGGPGRGQQMRPRWARASAQGGSGTRSIRRAGVQAGTPPQRRMPHTRGFLSRQGASLGAHHTRMSHALGCLAAHTCPTKRGCPTAHLGHSTHMPHTRGLLSRQASSLGAQHKAQLVHLLEGLHHQGGVAHLRGRAGMAARRAPRFMMLSECCHRARCTCSNHQHPPCCSPAPAGMAPLTDKWPARAPQHGCCVQALPPGSCEQRQASLVQPPACSSVWTGPRTCQGFSR